MLGRIRAKSNILTLGKLVFLVFILSSVFHAQEANAAAISEVKTGSGTIADTSSSATLTISPALTDITKTILFSQATAGSDANPNNTVVRCTLTNTTTITCDRDGTAGTVTIYWQTAEFSSGVTVQHLTGTDCDATDGIAEVSITAVTSTGNTRHINNNATFARLNHVARSFTTC